MKQRIADEYAALGRSDDHMAMEVMSQRNAGYAAEACWVVW